MSTERVKVVVTGGGTSGHVIPAMAILEMLMQAGYSTEQLRYVGALRGVETTLVPPLGVPCEFLSMSGLQRSWSLRGVARNMVLPWRLLRSTLRARRMMKQWRPDVVVSVGGYASEPCARAARAFAIPLVCVSYDRRPGLATRRQSRHAVASAVAFADTDLPRAVHTGAPVRKVLRHLDVDRERMAARARLGIGENDVVVTIVGGSLGSRVLNDAVPEIAAQLMSAIDGDAIGSDESSPSAVTIWHVTGPRYAAITDLQSSDSFRYEAVPYHDNMADLYAAVDVMVSRAGASTVAEIATVGIAAVVVPWSGAADNHQMLNAAWLGDAGAAVVLDDNSSPFVIASAVVGLVADTQRRTEVAHRARALGAVHRGDSLVRVIVDAAERAPGR